MGRLQILAKETLIYGISSIIGRVLNWLLVPLYTQFLAPDQYGIVTELYAYAAFFVIFYTYGMETAYFRFATKKNAEDHSYDTVQTALLITSFLFSAILILSSTPIVNYLDYPGKENYVVWFAIILAFDSVLALPFARLRLKGNAKRFAIAKIFNILINIGLNLFFIVFCLSVSQSGSLPFFKPFIMLFFHESRLVDYIFISNLIANAFLMILLGDQLFKFQFYLKWAELKPLLIYAFPILVMGLAGVTNEMLSRAMLKKWLPDNFYPGYSNQAALGIFGAAYKLSVFMTLAIQAFRYAAEPFFFTKSSHPDSKQLFSEVMNWFIIFGCLVFIAISMNLDFIGHLFLRSASYREGLSVVPVLLLANLFLGIYYNLSIWFKLTDKTYYGTIISTGGALITILLNWILIPLYGYSGSSYVTLACYFLIGFASFLLGQKHYPIPYRVFRGIIYISVASALVIAGSFRFQENILFHKFYQLILFLLFISTVLIFEQKKISTLFKRHDPEN